MILVPKLKLLTHVVPIRVYPETQEVHEVGLLMHVTQGEAQAAQLTI